MVKIVKYREKEFQDQLIADIEGLGGSAIHLEPVGHAGFPDLFLSHGDHFLLAELKSIESITNANFGTLFETGQLSWSVKWGMKKNRPVVILVEVIDENSVYIFDTFNPFEVERCAGVRMREVFRSCCERRSKYLIADWVMNQL